MLQGLSPLTTDWQLDLYQNLISRSPFETVHTKEGDLNVLKDRIALAGNPDRNVREAAFKKRYEALNSQRDLFAFTLIRLVKARNRLAQEHHFHGEPEEIYFERDLKEPDVEDLFRKIADQTNLYRRYQQEKANFIKAKLGYANVNY